MDLVLIMFALIIGLMFFLFFAEYLAVTTHKPVSLQCKEWGMHLIQGNWVAKIGVLIVTIGCGYLFLYLANHDLLPPAVRVGGLLAIGLIFLAIGQAVRAPMHFYFAVALQGGGLGFLYMAVYTALRFYLFISSTVAFQFFVGVSLVAAYLSLTRNAVSLAVLSMVGAFLAPAFTFEAGGPVLLFSYYLILDGLVFALAWLKGWRGVTHLSFFFVLFASLFFGFNREFYRPEFFNSTEPFLIIFFLIHFGLPLLEAWRANGDGVPRFARFDSFMVFGVPLTTFGLQYLLVSNFTDGAALSAMALGAFYLLWALIVRRKEMCAHFSLPFLCVGLIGTTLALPLYSHQVPIAGILAMEGLAVVWVGTRQPKSLLVSIGMLLQVLGAISYAFWEQWSPGTQAFLHASFFDKLFIAIAALASGYQLRQVPRGNGLSIAMFLWGTLWMLSTLIGEILDFATPETIIPLLMLCIALPWAPIFLLYRRQPSITLENWLVVGVLLCQVAWWLQIFLYGIVPGAIGYFAWSTTLGVLFLGLFTAGASPEDTNHPVGVASQLYILWFLSVIAIWYYDWIRPSVSLELCAVTVVVVALLIFSASSWVPIGFPHRTYFGETTFHFAAWVMLTWVIFASLFETYREHPLLNPLELVQLFCLISLALYLLATKQPDGQGFPRWRKPLLMPFLAAVVLYLHAIPTRISFHGGDDFFLLRDLLRMEFQAVLTFIWALLATVAMLVAARRQWRQPWIAGGGVLVAVTAKLFLVDLASADALANILAVIGVGLLMISVGYFAPIPPKAMNSTDPNGGAGELPPEETSV